MNEIEKRFDAAMDLVKWLNHRIEQQVEHQLTQRLEQEREYWRCTVSDLIAEERERVTVLLREMFQDEHKDVAELVVTNNDKIFERFTLILKGVDRMFDRLGVKLGDSMRRPDDDGEAPPSKH